MFKKIKEFFQLIQLEFLLIFLYLLILFFAERGEHKKTMLSDLRDIIFLKNLDYKKQSPFDKYFT